MRTRSISQKIKNDNKIRNNKFDDLIIEINNQKSRIYEKKQNGKENLLKRKRKAVKENLKLNSNGGKKSIDKTLNNWNRNLRTSPRYKDGEHMTFDLHEISKNLYHPKMMSEVFNENFVDSLMYWRHKNPPGIGLKNLGNTCFLNSVLQCVLYTVPLKNYLDYSEHSQMCKIKGVCFICEYGRLSKLVELKKSAIIPQNIIQNIRNIAHHIKIGRQEDAHEFLLYFLAAMENSATNYLDSISKKFSKLKKNCFPNYFEENNLIQKIFGGRLISSVTCETCKNSSLRSDKFIDISLEITGCKNISECFDHFCKPEHLTGNNKYFCEKCKQLNDSTKKLTFDKFVHLKRFDNKQRKIKNYIQFDKEIDLKNFIWNKNKEKVSFRLNSILVHEGSSIYSGHYYCYVRVSDNNWYCFDDDSVRKVEEAKVLKQTPYILFYEMDLNPNRIGYVKPKSVDKICKVDWTAISTGAKNVLHEKKNIKSKNERIIRHSRSVRQNKIKENIDKIRNEIREEYLNHSNLKNISTRQNNLKVIHSFTTKSENNFVSPIRNNLFTYNNNKNFVHL